MYNHKTVEQAYKIRPENTIGENKTATAEKIESIVLPFMPYLKIICPIDIKIAFTTHSTTFFTYFLLQYS